jgi:hypothetical protein
MKNNERMHRHPWTRHRVANAGISLLLACCAANTGAAIVVGKLPPAEEALHNVNMRLDAGDCKGAVERLNDGLAKAYPQVQLLAGAMYDQGACVKRNWERAVHFYLLANEAGQAGAIPRLAAGYAAPENGPDIGAALWWAGHERNDRYRVACQVSDAARNDPERFVTELQSWPRARLELCNYVVGVMMSVIGEYGYPNMALSYGLGADVEMTFIPAEARFDIKTTEIEEYNLYGVVDGDHLRDRRSGVLTKAFEADLRKVTDRALKRYPKPAGIDPALKYGIKFSFRSVTR